MHHNFYLLVIAAVLAVPALWLGIKFLAWMMTDHSRGNDDGTGAPEADDGRGKKS